MKKSFFEKLTPILLVLVIFSAVGVGILWQKVQKLEKGKVVETQDTAQPAKPTISLDQIKDLFSKDLIKFGDANSKVLFVEVTDPSCPYCHVAGGKNPELSAQIKGQAGDFPFIYKEKGGTYVPPVPEMKKLVEEGKASYVYMYTSGHGSGEMGAKAFYCAFEKGKYWQVHDILMTNKGYDYLNNTIKNDKTKSGELANFLKTAIDPAEMKACLDSGKYDARLNSDSSLAASININGTPGFYVNDTAFAGAYSFTDMQSVVDQALQ